VRDSIAPASRSNTCTSNYRAWNTSPEERVASCQALKISCTLTEWSGLPPIGPNTTLSSDSPARSLCSSEALREVRNCGRPRDEASVPVRSVVLRLRRRVAIQEPQGPDLDQLSGSLTAPPTTLLSLADRSLTLSFFGASRFFPVFAVLFAIRRLHKTSNSPGYPLFRQGPS